MGKNHLLVEAMKLTTSLFMVIGVICTSRAQSLDIQAGVDSLLSYTYYDPSFVRLTWTPNYVVTNEVTSILQSTDLMNWSVVVTEATNECLVTPILPQTFWKAENLVYTNSQ